MLKLNEGHMNVIHVQMMNQQDFKKVFPLLWIYIYTQNHGSHINTLKKDKINDSLKIFFWEKIPCIEFFYIGKLFELKNY
jgi:hypothetical protein